MNGIYKKARAWWGPGSCGKNGDGMNRQNHYNTETKIATVRRADGKTVGQIRDGVLRKTAAPNHRLATPPAWAWDVIVLAQARLAGATHTEITCGGVIWRAALEAFERHGIHIDRGHGEQIALPLKYWTSRAVGEPVVEQLALFSETVSEAQRPLPWERHDD